MKRTAFFQAVFLVLVLVGSWFLLILRFQDEPIPPAPEALPRQELPAKLTPSISDEVLQPDAGGMDSGETGSLPAPAAWQEWTDYLEAQKTPKQMREALASLKSVLFELPAESAVTRIMDLLKSGYDMETGLRFQVGRKGMLLGTGTLQATLLDWLGQLDPRQAAQFAHTELTQKGTALGPDAYVVHIRNFAWGTDPSEPNRNHFIKEQFLTLLQKKTWIDAAPPAIAEAMDIAVYLEESDLVPLLGKLTALTNPIPIRHAAGLALERLVDLNPMDSVESLIRNTPGEGLNPETRASYIARLDPVGPDAFILLSEYLASPDLSMPEATAFLQHFPNLNRSFSHNLLSPEFPDTGAANHADHLQRALQSVRDWQQNPQFSHLGSILLETENRMHIQLYGKPLP